MRKAFNKANTPEKMAQKIMKLKDEIAAKRDKLRELTNELNDIEADCTDAIEYMEYAADSLSKLL